MADRDRAAVDVENVVRDAELVLAVEHLHREGLVELPQADVAHLEPEAIEQLRNREHRPDAHLVRLSAGDGHADIAAERFQPALLGERGIHDDAYRCTVGKLAGVARGDDLLGSAHRLELLKSLERRLGTVAFVLLDRDLVRGDFPGLLVLDLHPRGHGNDLVRKAALGLGRGGALLGPERIFVAAFAADRIARADDFGRVDHRHVDSIVHRQQLHVRPEPHVGRLHQADALDSACDDHVHAIDDDLLCGSRDGHESRGALAVHRLAGDGDGEPCTKRGRAADGRLHALLERSAHDDIVDFRRIDLGPFYRRPDGMGGEGGGRRRVERAAIGSADWGSRGGNDHGIADGHSSLLNEQQAEPLGRQCGLFLALDFNGNRMTQQQLSGRFLLDGVKAEAAPDALPALHRSDEPHAVEPVIDGHLRAVRHEHDFGGHSRKHRQRQEAMGDGRAERRLRGRLWIDMDELPVLGRFSELVDPLLVHLQPA